MRILRTHWRTLLTLVVALGVVIGGSIGLVRHRNRERGVTAPVLWAVEALQAIPDSVVAEVYAVDAYHDAVARLADALRALPVDSVRGFYQRYSLWARDGVITADELRHAGIYLGLAPHREPTPEDVPAVNRDSTGYDDIP